MEGSISNTDVEYLNDTVWATIKKSEYGVGVFAIRDIKKGTQISEYSTDYLRIPDTFE